MMVSVFLAKLIGVYLLIFAAAWIIRKDQIDLAFKEFAASKALIVFSGLVNILIGLAIAIGHPVWKLNWMGLITALGYIILFSGIIRLAFPEKVRINISKIIDTGHWPFIAILIILGGILTYSGFMFG